jgi:hypothetical protein
MNKGQIILTLALTLYVASVAWAQGDEPPAPAPAPAFGQDNPAPTVSENPPISAIDAPGLEPHAAPESFLLPGLHFSESLDSNVGNSLGGSSFSTVTRGLGSLTLQKLWKNFAVAADYLGGAAYYARSGVGLQQLQQLDVDTRINWKRGRLAIRDSFSYLPEGTFGASTYGGEGAYSAGLGGMGSSMLGAGAFGGQNNAFNGGSGVSLGQVPRLTNLGLADVIENLTPKSSVTLSAGYGIAHFYGDVNSLTGSQQNISFIGSREETAQVGYDRTLNPKDQIALTYGYQGFDFATANSAFHSNVLQVMYGHRVSGRMDLTLSVGPQFTHIDQLAPVCDYLGIPVLGVPPTQCTTLGFDLTYVPQKANHIALSGRISLRYKFPKTTLSLSFQRYDTSGSGIFAGSLSSIAHLDAERPLSRVWSVFANLGYSKNQRLQLAGTTVNADTFTDGFAGAGLHRQFSRSLRGFVSYQFNILSFDTACPVPATSISGAACSNISQRQVGSIGLDWTPRPIRLD